MRRAKLGDVYLFHTERGYRIIQWVYSVENGEIYIRFPQDCKTIRYYIEQLYHLKEMVDSEQIEYSTYQYLKATFGKTFE